MPVTSLRLRIFLFSFAAISVALAASFFAINAGLKRTLTDRLRRSFYETESVLEQEQAGCQRRDVQLVATLGENSALKAAIGARL